MTETKLQQKLATLTERLELAEQTLNAIYHQEVDALVVAGPNGDQVFSLQGAEGSYRLLVEAMNEGALTLLPDGTILYCNSRFSEMTQCPMEQVIGSAWPRFFAPEEQSGVTELLTGAGDGGHKGEFSLRASDGTFLPVQLSARALNMDGVHAIAVLVTDIGELRKAHQALHLANDHLEIRVHERTLELANANEILIVEIAERKETERALAEAQKKLHLHAAELERGIRERTVSLQEKVEELEIFSYSISHDLRAPLRAIRSFSQILLEECVAVLSPEHADYLRRIVAGGGHLDTLIQEVLVYSRTARGALTLGPISLDTVVHDIIQNYPMFQMPGADLAIEGPLPDVIAHEALLTQCISNLLGNAVKFVSSNTVPRIKVRPELLGADVRVWFEDNGIGIHPCDHDRIFKLFERVNSVEDYPGTGIGLSIVKKAIERMGGSVGLESKIDRGSRFWIQLPRAAEL